MAIISDTTYRLTWGDYFSMDAATYNLKKKIIQIRDHGLEEKRMHPLDAFRLVSIDVQWLIRDVKENETLSNCPETSKVLTALKAKVERLVNTAYRLTMAGRIDNRDSSWEPSSFDTIDTSSALASGEGLWWPCVHVPFEVEVAVPHPDLTPGATTDGFSSWS